MTTPCSAPTTTEQYQDTIWAPAALIDQNMGLDGCGDFVPDNISAPQMQRINCSNAGVIGQDPIPSSFSDGHFPEIMSSFVLSKQEQNSGALSPPALCLASKHDVDKILMGTKRKRTPASGTPHSHTLPDGIQPLHQKDVSPESVNSPIGRVERNTKVILSPNVNTCKQNTKPTKEHSQSDDTPKEDYIHVRAKRGQATNSHSLAERVRRERISERMRLLQDLVPGCNKITGKAVMLDEIINYVQALQRQVEFLSMKLASVSPELNLDIEQILSKDIFHLWHGDSNILGYGPGISTTHPHLHGSTTLEFMQTELAMSEVPNAGDMLRVSIPQISPFAQISTSWNGDLQDVVQMDFIPDLPLSSIKLNDLRRSEL